MIKVLNSAALVGVVASIAGIAIWMFHTTIVNLFGTNKYLIQDLEQLPTVLLVILAITSWVALFTSADLRKEVLDWLAMHLVAKSIMLGGLLILLLLAFYAREL